jgi:coenzyme F420-reducing hydrogenase delta subunit
MHSLLEYVGVDRERVLVDWVSAAEGGRFAETVTEFTTQVKEMGPWGGKSVDQ